MRIIILRKLNWWYCNCNDYSFQANIDPNCITIRLVHMQQGIVHTHHLSQEETRELKDLLEEQLDRDCE